MNRIGGKLNMKRTLTVTTWAALLLAQASFAATTDSWTANNRAPNVYGAEIDNSNFYTTPSSVPRGALITSVSWDVGLHMNGATAQFFKICYATRYGTAYDLCEDISSRRTGTSISFKGLDAQGKFKITGFLYGGTYPVYPSHRNAITVGYAH